MQSPVDNAREKWRSQHPNVDTSPMEIVGPLKRAQALIGLALEPFYDGAAVSATELDLMLKLHIGAEPLIARQLAQQMARSGAAVSKALAKLERRALIERRSNPADRRAALIVLTEEGRRTVDALFPRQLAVEATLFEGLSAQDRARIIDGLTTLVATLEKAT